VPGLRVGHATLDAGGWLTGVTVVVAPPGGAVGGVDVRGGGPGTRETDLLDPRNAVERVNAIVLGGGSAYGLVAAHGVLTRLAALGRGVQIGTDETQVVPIVPAAILYDLGRGGVFGNYPGVAAGEAAFDDALATAGAELPGHPVRSGNAGAGTGALCGGLKGGIGSASTQLADPPGRPVTVAALAAVNSAGSVADQRTGILYGAQFGLPGEFDWLAPPSAPELSAGADRLSLRPRGGQAVPPGTAPRPLNTTIGVIATDARLTKAQCAKLAGVAHDGLARAIRPAHSMFDGDTIFALATGGADPGPGAFGDRQDLSPLGFHAILTAAADCFARAVVHAVLAASPVTTMAGTWRSYLDLFPSADTRRLGVTGVVHGYVLGQGLQAERGTTLVNVLLVLDRERAVFHDDGRELGSVKLRVPFRDPDAVLQVGQVRRRRLAGGDGRAQQ
jgi:putative pantetheine hydrolase